MTSDNSIECGILSGAVTEDAAEEILAAVRWESNDGKPVCPRCSGTALYRLDARRRFKCASCGCQYSVTTGTIFSGHKLPFSRCLQAMMIYERDYKTLRNGDLAQRLGVSYKTASVLKRKLWEAYNTARGPLSEPSYLMRGYWQGFNLWMLDENGAVVRENKKGQRRAVNFTRVCDQTGLRSNSKRDEK